MNELTWLKTRRAAMCDSMKSPNMNKETKLLLQRDLKVLSYIPYVVRGSLLLGIFFMVDWKKEKPIMKREVPLVLGAIFISALADIMAVNFVWSKYQKDVVKFTGFKNGIYFKPQTMEIMRSTAKLQNKISLNQYQLKDGEDEDEDEKIETAVNSQGEDADKSSASLR